MVGVIALVAAACGDDDSTPEADGDQEPIEVMVMATTSSPDFAFPEGAVAIRAHFRAVNEAGGINGRRVNVEVCNDQNDPNIASACARDAISSNVAAVFPYFSPYGATTNPIFEEAEIPIIGQLQVSPEDTTTPIGFAVDGSGAVVQVAVGTYLVSEEDCEQVGSFTGPNPAQTFTLEFTEKAVKAAGKDAFLITAPAAAPDYAPFIETALSRQADCLNPAVPASEIVKFVTALSQSAEPDITTTASLGSLNTEVRNTLGPTADGIIGYSSYRLTDEALAPVMEETAELDPDVPLSDHLLRGWTAAYVFTEVAKTLDNVNSSTVLRALSEVSDLEVPTVGTLDFTKKGPTEDFERAFNTNVWFYDVEGGEVTLRSDTPFDAAPVLRETG